jgi:hypothetical protein
MPVDFNITGDYLKNGVPIGGTNPTSGSYPINFEGTFKNGGLRNVTETLPTNFDYLGLRFFDNLNEEIALDLNPIEGTYSLGSAKINFNTFEATAFSGFIATSFLGEATIGCGISSPANGVFRASGNFGFVTIGTNADSSIGVDLASAAIRIGSRFSMFNITPNNPTTPVKWVIVSDENFNQYYLPLYQ